MAISEAALAGIKQNGRSWKQKELGIKEHAKIIGRANDGEDVTTAQVEAAVMSIVKALLAYPCSDDNMRACFNSVAEDLEMVADCELDEINYAMNRVYDELDFWRVLA